MDNEQLKRSRPGKTRETRTKGDVVNAGLYRHPESGNELIALEDALYGVAQAEAAIRAGFQYVGPAPQDRIVELPALAAQTRLEQERKAPTTDDLKGVQARLAQLEAENDALRNAPAHTQVPGSEATKQAAIDSVTAHVAANVDAATNPTGVTEVSDEEKPLTRQNSAELAATAKTEGVTFDSSMSNKQLVAAIKEKREADAAAPVAPAADQTSTDQAPTTPDPAPVATPSPAPVTAPSSGDVDAAPQAPETVDPAQATSQEGTPAQTTVPVDSQEGN